ncbi:MAG: aminotransferase class V-fold PLP-dependent enzyme [Gammaproteobacteria bacterium]|jgi:selenocysteine lyase/cysteine desulfurase|nr:aminotransferase class V-fold PLP-dependent enzyme [Gammaproteobacteria bacterium]
MDITTSRRQFLQSSGTLLLGAAASTATVKGAPRPATNPANADYWALVRSKFAFSETSIPMNAANLCPSFRSVAETVQTLTYDIDQDCSFNNRAKFKNLLKHSRYLVANQLNVSEEEIALVRNTSEANNIINNGLELNRGDEVLLWDQNHPTNNIAWDVRAARFGYAIKRVSTPAKPTNQQELIDTFVSQFTPRSRVLSITHVSNLSGIKLPIKEIIAAAHAKNIYVHVDGAQVWGALALDLKDLGMDSFSASAHKWYMGPKETGLLYVKKSRIDTIWPNTIAPGWGPDVKTTLPGARKFESLGQRDDAGLAALGVAAREHNDIGSQRTQQRITALSQRLKAGISELGLELVTPMDPELSFGVCITRAPDGDGRTIVNKLYTDYGIAAAPTGGVRLCPTIYNSPEHIDRAIVGLKELMT